MHWELMTTYKHILFRCRQQNIIPEIYTVHAIRKRFEIDSTYNQCAKFAFNKGNFDY